MTTHLAVRECDPGIFDCGFDDIPSDIEFCANYNDRYLEPDKIHGIVWFAAIVMAVMAFGIGSNDLANAWGTSVGSGAIDLKTAVFVAGDNLSSKRLMCQFPCYALCLSLETPRATRRYL